MDNKKAYILSTKFSFLYVFLNVLCYSIWGIVVKNIYDFIDYVTPHKSCGEICSIDTGQLLLGLVIGFFLVLLPFLYLIPKMCYCLPSKIVFKQNNDEQETIKAKRFSILIIILLYVIILYFVMPHIIYLFHDSANDFGILITLIIVGNLAAPFIYTYNKKRKK